MHQGWTWWRPTAQASGQATILTWLLLTGFYQMLLAHAVKIRVGRAGEIIISILKSLNGCNWTSTNMTMPDRFNQLNKKMYFLILYLLFQTERNITCTNQCDYCFDKLLWPGINLHSHLPAHKRGSTAEKKDLSNQCLRSPRCILSRDNSLEWKDQKVWVVVLISSINSCMSWAGHVASLDLTIQSVSPK